MIMTRGIWSLNLLNSIKIVISLTFLQKISLISTTASLITYTNSPIQLHRPHQRLTWFDFLLLLPCFLLAQAALLLRTASAFTQTLATAVLLTT
ncbi:uncharacterized protein EKO05_0006714 [Ascochyta rabiei]|uniref:uncharacterized protein n=1 Tax=Didymella rabiei TaxID=5454 RepID=UPI002207F8EC|nr:uncharacterized protein EKO05_0006714 [Ascochyta rabiei]UPX16305.1 hypothetical protein EKO05_0006714 [Ascochyta rabiei]